MISFIIAITLFTSLFAQDNWSLEKDKDGIRVYNRKVEDSKLKEFKGVVSVKASVEQVLSYFTDIQQHDKFMYKCKKGSVKLVKKNSASDFYTYMIIETPWPATNRDVVTHYQIGKPDKHGAVLIQLEGAADLVPEVDGLVRVPKMKGYWKFTPQSNGMTEIVHQAYSSPGGSLPEGMANAASVDAPYYMLSKLRELLEKK
jgi:hypothetical protein